MAFFHQIDRAPNQTFQSFGQAKKLLQRWQCAVRLELDQEICIAGVRVKVVAPRRRTKHLQPPHPVVAAKRGDLGAVLMNQPVHDAPQDSQRG